MPTTAKPGFVIGFLPFFIRTDSLKVLYA